MCCLSACGLVSTTDPAVVTSIDEELRLDLWNPLDQSHPLELRLQTLEPKCVTSQILTTHQQTGSSLQVTIEGLAEQPECQGGSAFLQSAVPAHVSPGAFAVTIQLGTSVSNRGILTFDGQVYRLSMDTSDGLLIGHDELYDIPPGTIWGRITSDQNVAEINEIFLDELTSVSDPADLPSGYYGHFRVLDADVQLTPSVVATYNYPFICTLNGQLSALQEIIDDFRTAHGNTISIECTTWHGKSL